MGVTVVIPWMAGDDSRFAALRWLERRLVEADLGSIQVAEVEGEWSKPRAILAGVERASGDVIVVHDADCWTDGLPHAIAAVQAGYPWAVPHHAVRRLTAEATHAVLSGAEPTERMACTRRPYRGVAGGGVLVVPRATIAEVPPDVRFTGWGCEDGAWRDALRCLAGMEWRQTRAPLYHLHHTPQPRVDGRTSPENAALAVRYSDARDDRDAMRVLVAEARVPA